MFGWNLTKHLNTEDKKYPFFPEVPHPQFVTPTGAQGGHHKISWKLSFFTYKRIYIQYNFTVLLLEKEKSMFQI